MSSDQWYNLLHELGVFTLIVSGITYLLRFYLSKRIENHKKELEIGVKDHVAKLNLFHSRDQTMYDRRVKFIEELYEKLYQLDESIKRLIATVERVSHDTDPNEHRINKILLVRDNLIQFKGVYNPKRILLAQQTCNLIDELFSNYTKIFWERFDEQELRDMGAKVLAQHFRDSLERCKELHQQANGIKNELENTFRDTFQLVNELQTSKDNDSD